MQFSQFHRVNGGKNKFKQTPNAIIVQRLASGSNNSDNSNEESVFIELPSDVSGLTTVNSRPVSALGGIVISFVKVGSQLQSDEMIGAEVTAAVNGQDVSFVIASEDMFDVDNGSCVLYTKDMILPALLNITAKGTTVIPMANLYGEDVIFDATDKGLYFIYMEGLAKIHSLSKK